jgi:hypothetical protein
MHIGIVAARVLLGLAALFPLAQAQECPTDGAKTAQEVISFLKGARSKSDTNPRCIQRAIDDLGGLSTREYIDVLVEYLDFERPGCKEKKELDWGCVAFGKYSAAGQLAEIGKPSLPGLLGVINRDNSSRVVRSVAIQTVMEIFRDNRNAEADGIRFLLNEAAHSANAEQSARLRQAASDALPFCYGKKAREQCEAVLNSQAK